MRAGIGRAVMFLSTLAVVGLAPSHAIASRSCAPENSAAPVRKALDEFYAALRDSDEVAWRKVTAPDFRAYDVGAAFDRQSLFALIREAKGGGKSYEWHPGAASVTADCRLAFATWVNHGSISDSSGALQLTWLESASLAWREGRWVVEFLHSTRAAPTKPEPSKPS